MFAPPKVAINPYDPKVSQKTEILGQTKLPYRKFILH